ncbi:YhdX family protein [Aeribacillus kexueae]|nr:YhdX family protein [Bacillus kexueae]
MGRGRVRVEERIKKEMELEMYEATLIQQNDEESKESE